MTQSGSVEYMVVFDRYVSEVPEAPIDPSARHVFPLWLIGIDWGLWAIGNALTFALQHGTEPPAKPAIVGANLVGDQLVPADAGDRNPGMHLMCRRLWHGERYVRVAADAYMRGSEPGDPGLSAHAVLEVDRMATGPRLTDFARMISGPPGRYRRVIGLQVIALGNHRMTDEVDAAWDHITRRPGDGRQ